MNILLTGVTGFVGNRLASHISSSQSYSLVCSVRGVNIGYAGRVVQVDGLGPSTDWSAALTGQQLVVHTAARAHVKKGDTVDELINFRLVNAEGTLNLARQAAAAGVLRFIFLSSIGVNGAETFHKPFTSEDIVAPNSPYAISKCEAEMGLQSLAAETGMEVVIIRPPLVYGPNAPGNFGSLLRWLKYGLPLPLGAIHNKRSLVALDNLVDLIMVCLTHPDAANQIFLVSDGEDVSTTELLRRIAQAMGHTALLVPVPRLLLSVAARLLGKGDLAQSLCGSLQIDMYKTRQVLGWTPPLTFDEGLFHAVL